MIVVNLCQQASVGVMLSAGIDGNLRGRYTIMSNKNDITGDKIITKTSPTYAQGYDRIFRKPKFTDSDRYQLIRKAVLNQKIGLTIDKLNLAIPKTELEFDQCIDGLLVLIGK
jgi:hypothetical protein